MKTHVAVYEKVCLAKLFKGGQMPPSCPPPPPPPPQKKPIMCIVHYMQRKRKRKEMKGKDVDQRRLRHQQRRLGHLAVVLNGTSL